MNVASLDLCRELYELSGWEFKRRYPCWVDNATKSHAQEGYPKLVNKLGLKNDWEYGKQYGIYKMFPAYDLGYLLRKLEAVGETIILRYNNPENMTAIALSDWNRRYTAATVSMTQGSYPIATTPEDATAKLAIRLFKKGVLEKSA